MIPAPVTSPLDLIAADLRAVDAVIGLRLQSGVPLVAEVAHYIIGAGGKRLRPALLLLTSLALGCADPRRLELAAVVEFIHTATLLHDDVVDESALRRGRPTANQQFGNAASVLVGDFLYSRAFQMMVDAGDLPILRVLADATNVIAEGEVLQLMNLHDPNLDEQAYLRVIRSKTAKLFEASARIGAMLAAAPEPLQQACADYGAALGTAFQVIDDLLDYEGDTNEIGKNLGDDLREGKATLPLIIAMQRCAPADRQTLVAAIEQGNADVAQIAALVRACGAVHATREAAARQGDLARDAALHLPAGPGREALLELAAGLLLRRA